MNADPSPCLVPLVDEPIGTAVEVFDHFRSRGLAVPNLYRALANTPRLLSAWVALAWPLRRTSSSADLRELAIAHLAAKRGCEYVETHHRHFAAKAGISPSRLALVGDPAAAASSIFTEAEQLTLTLVDEVVRDGVGTPRTVAALSEVLGQEQMMELLVTVAFYEAVCVLNGTLRIPLEPGATS